MEDRGDMEKMEKSWPNAACFPRSSWGLFDDLARSSYGMDVDEHDGGVGFLISDPVDSFYVAQYLSFRRLMREIPEDGKFSIPPQLKSITANDHLPMNRPEGLMHCQ